MEQDPADPKAIERGWISTMYSQPPDLVFDEGTGFPAANPGTPSSLQEDPVPLEPQATDDWRKQLKDWFDSQP